MVDVAVETVRVDAAEPPDTIVMVAGLADTVGPPVSTGDRDSFRLTLPLNPLALATVIGELFDVPATRLIAAELAASVKPLIATYTGCRV